MTDLAPSPSMVCSFETREAYAAQRRQASTDEVIAGRRPLRRLSAPGIPPKAEKPDLQVRAGKEVQPRSTQASWSRTQVEEAVLVRAGRGGLQWSLPGRYDPGEMSERIARLAPVLVEDPPTAMRVAESLRTLGRSDRFGAGSQFVDLVATSAGSPALAALDTLMARTFWAPHGVASIADWCATFGVSNTFDGWRVMLGHALRGTVAGRQLSVANGVHALESALLDSLRYMGRSGSRSNAVFTLSTRLAAANSAYMATDASGSREALRTGDASLVNPIRDAGSLITAVLSAPIRFRPGSLALHTGGGTFVGAAVLRDLSWDAQRRCHLGTFTVREVRTGQDRVPAVPLGIRALRASMPQRGSAEVFVATPEVYLRAYTHRTDSVWADGGTPERVTREVPLDVALAGAPR